MPRSSHALHTATALVLLYGFGKLLAHYKRLSSRQHAFVDLGRTGPLAVWRRALSDSFTRVVVGAGEAALALTKPRIALETARSYLASNVVHNLAYGPGERNHLDVFMPRGAVPEKLAPTLVFVHGGAVSCGERPIVSTRGKLGQPAMPVANAVLQQWSWGHKWQYSAWCAAFAKAGVCVVNVNYHVYPTGTVDEQVEDVRRAILWTKEHIAEYKGDPENIHIAGHSAGAHLCATVLVREAIQHFHGHQGVPRTQAVAEASASAHGMPPSALLRAVQSCITISGVFDIDDHYKWEAGRTVYGILHGVEWLSPMAPAMACKHSDFSRQSPKKLVANHLDGVESLSSVLPPFTLIHGLDDVVVPPSSSQGFCRVLAAAGHAAKLIEYDGVGHGEPVTDLMTGGGIRARLVADVLRILEDPILKGSDDEAQHAQLTDDVSTTSTATSSSEDGVGAAVDGHATVEYLPTRSARGRRASVDGIVEEGTRRHSQGLRSGRGRASMTPDSSVKFAGGPAVRKDDSGSDVQAAVCLSQSLRFVSLPVTGDRHHRGSVKPAQAAISIANDVFAAGELHMEPRAEKDAETSNSNVLSFRVTSAELNSLELVLPPPPGEDALPGGEGYCSTFMGPGDCFCIPAHTVYALVNHSKVRPAELSFVVIKNLGA